MGEFALLPPTLKLCLVITASGDDNVVLEAGDLHIGVVEIGGGDNRPPGNRSRLRDLDRPLVTKERDF